MYQGIVSGFAAVGMAAAIIIPLGSGAQGREMQSERDVLTINQITDLADARIATLKADLRLTPDQTQHWASLNSALHDIAVKRAKRLAAAHDLQTGRASSNSNVTSDSRVRKDDTEKGAYKDRDSRMPDDIEEMRDEADAFTIQAADLRQIADAAQPLYETLDDHQRKRLVQFIRQNLKAGVMSQQRGLRR